MRPVDDDVVNDDSDNDLDDDDADNDDYVDYGVDDDGYKDDDDDCHNFKISHYQSPFNQNAGSGNGRHPV